MIQHMFCVPFLQIQCKNWQVKKNQLKLESKNHNFEKKGGVLTNYFNKGNNCSYSFILEEEIDIFKTKFNFKKVVVNYIWYEKSLKHNFHEVHNHGQCGFSAVCYIEYDDREHVPLSFMSPFNDFVTGSELIFTPNTITEGSIIFFPSSIYHFVNPNFSNKERLVVSFNLECSF